MKWCIYNAIPDYIVGNRETTYNWMFINIGYRSNSFLYIKKLKKKKRNETSSIICYHWVDQKRNNNLYLLVFVMHKENLKGQVARSGWLWGGAGARQVGRCLDFMPINTFWFLNHVNISAIKQNKTKQKPELKTIEYKYKEQK